MQCNDARARLHAYLDKELDVASVLDIDRHLASCAACRAAFERQSALRSGIRTHAQYHAAPEALAARVRARLGTGSAPRRPAFARWLELGGVAAAAAAVAWIAAIQYAGPSATESLADQVIAGHARAVLTSHVVDVETSDQHTVKPWLSSKLDFSPPVVDLADAGFPLVGGRLDYLDHRPVATLVYHARQHVIDLFVWPDQGSSSRTPMRTVSRHGYNVLHWSDGSMEYWAISDLNAVELTAFAERYSASK